MYFKANNVCNNRTVPVFYKNKENLLVMYLGTYNTYKHYKNRRDKI